MNIFDSFSRLLNWMKFSAFFMLPSQFWMNGNIQNQYVAPVDILRAE